MKLKIDKDGSLWIERPTGMVKQYCPYNNDPCSHDCPLFREPLIHEDGQISLALCNTAYIVNKNDFNDERI